jgi:hypothetical protein
VQRFIPVCMVALSLVTAGTASASQVVLTSRAPYRDVGTYDEALSHLCALGKFGPRVPGSLIARFVGKDGPGVLDVAKGTGLNLVDSNHRARVSEDYFFHDAGTTSCEVLVGGRKN